MRAPVKNRQAAAAWEYEGSLSNMQYAGHENASSRNEHSESQDWYQYELHSK